MQLRVVLLAFVAVVAAACASAPLEPPSADGAGTGSRGAQVTVPAPVAVSEDVGRAEPSADAPVAELAAGLNNAGFDLLRTLPEDGNVVFGPSSIGHALLMARAAADDDTRAAIDAAFALPAGDAAHEAWNTAFSKVMASADADDEIVLSIADRIWPRVEVTPDQDWVDLLAAYHGVDVQPVDFAGDPDGSRQSINSWVADNTQGLIPELLPLGVVRPETVLVLTDAWYLKARWQYPFGKYEAEPGSFTRPDGSTVPVEFLRHLDLTDRRGTGDGFVGAEIPYDGGEFSMLVLVPDADRFDEVRDRLDQALLDDIDATFTTGPYELLLPPWEDTAQIDLLPWLSELGAAPGSYPAIALDAFLDAAVHGADITVDEWGTVAAATTALGFAVESGPPEPELTVRADRPFLYLIRHRPTGLVLFAGQVTDPT